MSTVTCVCVRMQKGAHLCVRLYVSLYVCSVFGGLRGTCVSVSVYLCVSPCVLLLFLSLIPGQEWLRAPIAPPHVSAPTGGRALQGWAEKTSPPPSPPLPGRPCGDLALPVPGQLQPLGRPAGAAGLWHHSCAQRLCQLPQPL